MNSAGVQSSIQLGNAGIAQTIQWNSDGNIYLRRGGGSSTIIATGTGSMFPLALNSTHFISFDSEIKNAGGRTKVWVDGTLVIDYSGDNNALASDGCNYVALYSDNSKNRFDHFYMDCYLAGGGSELPFLTNPIVYTDNPDSDSAANFTIGTTILGDPGSFDWTTTASDTTTTWMRRVQANASGNLASIYIMPWSNNATVKCVAAIYNDSAGSPGTLVAATAEVTGFTAQVSKQLTFGSPPALTAGSWYWIAFRTNTTIKMLSRNTALAGLGLSFTTAYSTTFATPAPTTVSAAEIVCWGVMTGMTSRADTLDVPNYTTTFSYNFSATPGQEDLFTPPAIPGAPTGIHHVAIKTFSYRSDSGARTVDMRLKSGASTYSGSLTGITPNALTPNWIGTNFRKDPNGNIAWTKANLDASKFGYKLVT